MNLFATLLFRSPFVFYLTILGVIVVVCVCVKLIHIHKSVYMDSKTNFNVKVCWVNIKYHRSFLDTHTHIQRCTQFIPPL